jgi:hypothetical protein
MVMMGMTGQGWTWAGWKASERQASAFRFCMARRHGEMAWIGFCVSLCFAANLDSDDCCSVEYGVILRAAWYWDGTLDFYLGKARLSGMKAWTRFAEERSATGNLMRVCISGNHNEWIWSIRYAVV